MKGLTNGTTNGARQNGTRQNGAVGGTTALESGGRPWYVQFWPLFLVFLMVASIGGSLATVAIAYRHADVDVRAASVDTARGEHAQPESPR